MVTKGMWRVATDTKKNQSYCFGVYSGDLHIANMIDQDGTTIEGRAESWENVQLIVTAVNACKTINEQNPQAVAEQIGKFYELLKSTTLFMLEHRALEFITSSKVLCEASRVLAKCEAGKES